MAMGFARSLATDCRERKYDVVTLFEAFVGAVAHQDAEIASRALEACDQMLNPAAAPGAKT
jgi:hypothetical protein